MFCAPFHLLTTSCVRTTCRAFVMRGRAVRFRFHSQSPLNDAKSAAVDVRLDLEQWTSVKRMQEADPDVMLGRLEF